MASSRFSFSSVILSYFLVGGGMFTGTLVTGTLGVHSEVGLLLLLAAGAFVGGFVAARASHGSTILEPALGAVAVIATIVGLASRTELGRLVWNIAQDETLQVVAKLGAAGLVGSLGGAFVSEKLLGEATRSSVPWIAYTGLSTFGACMLTTLAVAFFMVTGAEAPDTDAAGRNAVIGIAIGCLLAGLAVGASARMRPLLAALLGGGLGVAGFFVLVMQATTMDKDAIAGTVVLAVGGALVTLLGTAIGWATVGKRSAG